MRRVKKRKWAIMYIATKTVTVLSTEDPNLGRVLESLADHLGRDQTCEIVSR